MINTFNEKAFGEFVRAKILDRRERVEKKRDMQLDFTPEFAAALRQTSLLGTKRGRGAFMVKSSYKRPKTLVEKREELEE